MRENVRLGKCKFELDGEPCCNSCYVIVWKTYNFIDIRL